MTTKQLTSRQARWAEALSEYYFMIMYRSGKKNGKADALTRRDDEVEAQNGVKTEYRTKAILSQDQVDPRVLQDLGVELSAIDLAPADPDVPNLVESLGIVDRIIRANRHSPSLEALRAQAASDHLRDLTLEDGLLLHVGRLVLPKVDNLPTDLIREAHD